MQHRMAGLAVIQVAQKVSKAFRSLHLDWKMPNKTGKKPRKKEKFALPVQNRGGGSCSTSSISEPSTSFSNAEDKMISKRHLLSWQEVYNIAVKWRQISEPCDPVVWINKLRWLFFFLYCSSTSVKGTIFLLFVLDNSGFSLLLSYIKT